MTIVPKRLFGWLSGDIEVFGLGRGRCCDDGSLHDEEQGRYCIMLLMNGSRAEATVQRHRDP